MPEVASLCPSSLLFSRSIPFDGDHPSGHPDHPSASRRKAVAFRLGSVVAFKRNQWSPSNGIGGRLGPEYATALEHKPCNQECNPTMTDPTDKRLSLTVVNRSESLASLIASYELSPDLRSRVESADVLLVPTRGYMESPRPRLDLPLAVEH
jgi:hypothetical protein